MFKYFIKRLLFAVLALFILLVLVFFLMQAVPGYPITRENNDTDATYLQKVRDAGLLDNVFVQFWNFLSNLFTKGDFGLVYKTNGSVIEKMLVPIQYTLMIAGPAFVLSSIFGVLLGIVSAYYRGKWPDILINGIAVLFISIPSFIFALYLIKLAGVIGLPTQFIDPASGVSASKVLLSILTPILSMTLSSISIIIYYTRNELVEVFKQEYIKTALSKGFTFRKVVFKYAMRNAMIPIISILAPSFVTILSGSIIIEKFFNVPGTASVLVTAITDKEIYVVLFTTIFYSSIYFIIQIFVDFMFTVIDPRIILAEKSSASFSNRVKSKFQRGTKNFLFKNSNILTNNIISNKIRYKLMMNNADITSDQINDEENTDVKENLTSVNLYRDNYIAKDEIIMSKPIYDTKYQKISKNWFEKVDIFNMSFEQISGKPTSYITDLFKRFFKSKAATFFTGLLGLILLISIVVSVSTIHTINNPISLNVPASILAYLPPRIPWLGVSGITNMLVDADTFAAINALGIKGIYSSFEEISGQYQLYDFDPYLIPSLKNVTTFLGTDGLGRNWSTLLWYSTLQSLILATIVSFFSVVLGTIYGSISGSRAGRMTDVIMMRIVEILSGVPLILWILIFGLVFSDGNLSLPVVGLALILVSWMWPSVTARTYIIKYKDAEFVQAAKTLGASEFNILFFHMLPNIAGRLFVILVNLIPKIIFFEASLVFLGVRSTSDISLGTMIETSRLNPYPFLLIGPTLMIVLITLSSQIISNNLNDALDPKVSGK